MDLSWCPVCDQQTFALENLYCSEACRRKDESNPSYSSTDSSSISKSFYEFPRCASRKLHQSPYNISTFSLNNTTSLNSSVPSPPTSSFSTMDSIYCYSDYYYYVARPVPDPEEETSHKLSSSPSEFLQLSRIPPKSKTPARKKRSSPMNGVSSVYH